MKFLAPIISRYSSILVQFWIVTLISRSLTTEDVGTYFVISGAVLTLYFLSSFGVADGLILVTSKRISRGHNRQAATRIFGAITIGLISLVPFCLLVGIAAYTFTTSWLMSGLVVLWLLGYCLCFIASQALIAMHKVRVGTFIFYSAVNFALLITTAPYLLTSSDPSLISTVAWISLPALFAGLSSISYCYLFALRPRTRISLRYCTLAGRRSACLGWSIAIGRLVQSSLLWSPVWASGIIIGANEAAQVGLATRLYGVLGALLAAVRFSVRPQIAKLASAGEWLLIETLSRRIALSALVFVFITFLFVLLAGNLAISLLFGPSYSEAWLLLLIMFGAFLGESMGGPVDEVLRMTGYATRVMYFQTAFVFAFWVAAWPLAVEFGTYGVAVAFAIAMTCLYGALSAFLHRKHRIVTIPFLKGSVK